MQVYLLYFFCLLLILFLSLVENGNYKISNMLENHPIRVCPQIHLYSKNQTRNILVGDHSHNNNYNLMVITIHE